MKMTAAEYKAWFDSLTDEEKSELKAKKKKNHRKRTAAKRKHHADKVASTKGKAIPNKRYKKRSKFNVKKVVGSTEYVSKVQAIPVKEHTSHENFKASEYIPGTKRKPNAVHVDRVNNPNRCTRTDRNVGSYYYNHKSGEMELCEEFPLTKEQRDAKRDAIAYARDVRLEKARAAREERKVKGEHDPKVDAKLKRRWKAKAVSSNLKVNGTCLRNKSAAEREAAAKIRAKARWKKKSVGAQAKYAKILAEKHARRNKAA